MGDTDTQKENIGPPKPIRKTIITKLLDEVKKYESFCKKLFEVRYEEAKYEDAYYDNLLKKFHTTQARISLLKELIEDGV